MVPHSLPSIASVKNMQGNYSLNAANSSWLMPYMVFTVISPEIIFSVSESTSSCTSAGTSDS